VISDVCTPVLGGRGTCGGGARRAGERVVGLIDSGSGPCGLFGVAAGTGVVQRAVAQSPEVSVLRRRGQAAG